MTCKSTDTSFFSCNMTYTDSCAGGRLVGVSCYEPELKLRLADTIAGGMQGRVEVFVDGSWSNIDDAGFDEDNARVICRQLGFPSSAARVLSSLPYANNNPITKIWGLNCRGDESNIGACERTSITSGQRSSGAAGVACVPANFTLRVVAGSNPYEGRVEVNLNGNWGRVAQCDGTLVAPEAAIVMCRSLAAA
ncbi:hypothetical protein PLESTM_000727800 [Pleodorina starrii]|nr:hypothetical protein PLESTM_000727800 [Pleodorina starrii]